MLKWALILAFVLLPAVAAEGRDKALDIGVKLCGREFIRSVVKECGGSRWKRYSQEPGQEPTNPYKSRPLQVPTLQVPFNNSSLWVWKQGRVAYPRGELLDWLNSDHFFMLPDQVNSLPDGEDQHGHDTAGHSATFGSSPLHNLQEGTLHEEEENSYLTEASPRARRNAGPGGSCCRHGCTKTELVRFC